MSLVDGPGWLANIVEGSTYLDEYRYYVIAGAPQFTDTLISYSDVLSEGYDVFLRGDDNRILRIDLDMLNDSYYEVCDGMVALHKDTIEYVVVDHGPHTRYPEWAKKYLVKVMKQFEWSVLLRADNGVVKILDWDTFAKYYYFEEGGYPYNKQRRM